MAMADGLRPDVLGLRAGRGPSPSPAKSSESTPQVATGITKTPCPAGDMVLLYVALFRGAHHAEQIQGAAPLDGGRGALEEFAKKTGIPREVAKEFVKEDDAKPRKLPERVGDE